MFCKQRQLQYMNNTKDLPQILHTVVLLLIYIHLVLLLELLELLEHKVHLFKGGERSYVSIEVFAVVLGIVVTFSA